MYLTPETMRNTLAQIASRSAAGSTLIVNYHTSGRSALVGLYLWLIGEPMKSHWSPEGMASDLAAAGFQVDEDSGLADWAARYATGAVKVRHGRHMRIAVARHTRDRQRLSLSERADRP